MSLGIRARGFGEALDISFQLLRQQFSVLVALGAIPALALAPAQYTLQERTQGQPLDDLGTLFVVSASVFFVLTGWIQPAMTRAASMTLEGRQPSFNGCAREGATLWLRGIGVIALLAIAILTPPLLILLSFPDRLLGARVAVFLLLLLSLFLGVRCILMLQALTIEKLGPFAALRRSSALVKGYWWRTFWLYAIALLIVTIVSQGLSFVFALLPVVGIILTALSQAVSLAFVTSLLTVIYYDLRCRKEDYDLEALAGEVAEGGAGMAQGS